MYRLPIRSYLILKNGLRFSGYSPSWMHRRSWQGELVFTTAMVGYSQAITDPSYRGQVLCFSYPLIGTYGMPCDEWESSDIHVAGIIINELQYCGDKNHEEFFRVLNKNNIPYICGIDTRSIVHIIRDEGAMSCVLSTSENSSKKMIDINTMNLVAQVSVHKPTIYKHDGQYHLAILDCGIKQGILRALSIFDWKITLLPYNHPLRLSDYDALLISNGPGNPETLQDTIFSVQKAFSMKKPIFGICLGAQIMALAAGATTYKMKFGHRALNHPVQQCHTPKAYLTTQNHGFAIKRQSLSNDWEVSFVHINDGSVQGIRHISYPYSAVQFHPEHSPGPCDTMFLFQDFFKQVSQAS